MILFTTTAVVVSKIDTVAINDNVKLNGATYNTLLLYETQHIEHIATYQYIVTCEHFAGFTRPQIQSI